MATSVPKAESTTGAVGTSGLIPDALHQHPRLTSPHTGTLNASAEDTVTFSRTFDTKPAWADSWEEATDNGVVVLKVKSWVQDGNGKYTGATIKGYRSRAIPTNLVSALLNGVYDLFTATGAAGVNYSMTFIQSAAP